MLTVVSAGADQYSAADRLFVRGNGASDGDRTHDLQIHNLAL